MSTISVIPTISTTSTSATDQLIAFVRELEAGLLPGEVVSQAKRCVLDLLGSAIAGSTTRLAQVCTRFGVEQFAPGDSTLVGSRARLKEVGATWVNGVCASALDLDDGNRRAMGHPGVTVIPTALVFAEAVRASGPEFLAAVVAGYEVAVRASVARVPGYKVGHFSSGIWGVLGSAATACKLLGFDEKGFQDAVGIGVCHGPLPPSGPFVNDSMIKEVVGWGGLVGVSSAFLAQDGFIGPRDALDRSERYDTSQLVEGLGEEYAIMRTYFKPYASCRWSHSAIDAALALTAEHGISVEEIEEIHVEGFEETARLRIYAPVSTVQAQYSIPFSMALALTYGKIGPAELDDENLQKPALLELARRVKISVLPEFARLFPEKTVARVTIHTRRGDFTRTVEYPRGNPENPLGDAELAGKFRWLTVDVVGEERSREIEALVGELEHLEDVGRLVRLLAF